MVKKCFLVFLMAVLMFFSIGNISTSSAAGNKFIIINKATNQLAYYENNQLKKVFKVGTGRSQSLTPEGKFKIVNKIKNRPYYKGGIPGGDPRNPLGNRWLGINARGTWGTTYAIHGNNNPNSIGGYVSSGCVRMYDNEVEWLYNQVPVGTPVMIVTSGKSFDSIAVSYGYKVSKGSVPATSNGATLKKGDRGPAVAELQRKLTALGYNTKGVDGVFGSNTDKAVRQFQKARHLVADGIVGPATRKALGGTTVTKPTPPSSSSGSALYNSGTLKRGSKGAAVKELQRILTAKGFNTNGMDGVFGSNTERAVRQFQQSRGLTADGIVGPSTKKALRN
ncbi:N-acetylmuramoyl-L-alanine amidase [Bacillus sp. SA1-12]|uniref:L,D-transpeptidase family protein n=1 Tax=Bacillus sp. SA1-12 TaxID=1455638 RepID=UPI0006271D27|nr:peptidoglycan-binding protein [Bacillus sp. SA1-12]KKI89401.1 N-acetylmuramoyl-L-alanine amidase [Bacillus sp. SA1-12]